MSVATFKMRSLNIFQSFIDPQEDLSDRRGTRNTADDAHSFLYVVRLVSCVSLAIVSSLIKHTW